MFFEDKVLVVKIVFDGRENCLALIEMGQIEEQAVIGNLTIFRFDGNGRRRGKAFQAGYGRGGGVMVLSDTEDKRVCRLDNFGVGCGIGKHKESFM